MANPEHVEILKQGVEIWNQWRDYNSDIEPDLDDADLAQMYLENVNLREAALSGVNLSNSELIGADLSFANLKKADLSDAVLSHANLNNAILTNTNIEDARLDFADLSNATLTQAILSNSTLTGATLVFSNLQSADLQAADLSGVLFLNAYLFNTNFGGANLCSANFTSANLSFAHLNETILQDTDWKNAILYKTVLADVDLSEAKRLDEVRHIGPSTIGLDTILRSQGKIPETFLRGCGVPDSIIDYLPSLIQQPIQFESCFISYSHKDEDFARRLFERMRAAGLRVWYAPEDGAGGKKLHEQIEQAIQMHDRLLIVLSENSLKSEWVMTEIRNARQEELRRGVRKLFPIRLVDFDTIRQWKCFDPDTGKDLAVEVREYLIPDFSGWKDHDTFEAAFKKLLRDLKQKSVAK